MKQTQWGEANCVIMGKALDCSMKNLIQILALPLSC